MEKEKSKWSSFLTNSKASLALVREIAILTVCTVLIFRASWITPTLKDIGLALEDAGFTEVNVGGLKQDLKNLRQKAQDSKLELQQVKESLEKAQESLRQPNPNITDALDKISTAQTQLHFTQKEITSISQPLSLHQSADQWVVVIGADRKIEAAKDEVNTAKSKGFDNAIILLRDGWYRTIIPFSSEKDANGALSDISKQIREGSYTRNLTTWCKQIIEKSEKSVKFKECV